MVVAQSSDVEFYNDVYRANPGKWAAAVERDFVAFKLLSKLHEEPEGMLDFGCGNGHTLQFFKDKWPDTKYTGVDISDVALKLAQIRVPEGKFYQTMPEGKWDIITIMGVAEHFPHPASELERLASYLEPGGHIYLEVPNCLSYSDSNEEGFRETFAGAGQIEWHWKRKTWEKAIRDAGLEITMSFWSPIPTWEFIWVLGNGR